MWWGWGLSRSKFETKMHFVHQGQSEEHSTVELLQFSWTSAFPDNHMEGQIQFMAV